MGRDLHAVLPDAVPHVGALANRGPGPDDRGRDIDFVVHAHRLEERRVHDGRATDLAGLAEDHVRTESTFDEGPRAHVDRRPQAPRGDARLPRNLDTTGRGGAVMSVDV